MLTVFGSVALDTTRTPFETKERIMGGAATYASMAASFFTPVSLIGVVGNDFPNTYYDMLKERVDLKGLSINNNKKSFFYDSSFDYDLSHRTTNVTQLNALEDYNPVVPDEYTETKYLYLANNDPIQNIKIIEKFKQPSLVVCDTIEYWIQNKKDAVFSMIEKTNGVVINDQEARLLCETSNLLKCGKELLSRGPNFAIIKKGEHGVLFFTKDTVIPVPGYPLESVVDPTGAGDSFAGGFFGYLISRKSDKVMSDLSVMKEAILMGSVMGTFAIEAFGPEKLFAISIKDIHTRYNKYKQMLSV